MGEITGIGWTDSTFNPVIGCTKVSAACDFCYAEELAERYGWVEWGGARKRTSLSNWKKPAQWNRSAAKFKEITGRRRRVFCASLADVFDNQWEDEWRSDLWALIRECKELDWQLLTKRPQNFKKFLPDDWGEGWEHVWLGTTAENQTEADRRIPILLSTPAAVRFVSYEPALEPVDFSNFMWPVHACWQAPYNSAREAIAAGASVTYRKQALVFAGNSYLDWLIIGGESGAHARPFDIDWARAALRQCELAGVAAFMKQLGENPYSDGRPMHSAPRGKYDDPEQWPPELRVRQFPR